MRRKSHYRILGIPRGESPEGIRAAYRRLAKELHPDHGGESSANAFREIQQAYDVLSDPKRRRRYDHQLDRKRPARSWRADPLTRHHDPEPLVAEPQPVATTRRDPSSAFDELFDRFLGDVTPIGDRSRPVRNEIDLDVTIPAAQAARGGTLTLDLPVREPCGICAGTGVDWPFPCVACGQQGWIVRNRVLHLQVAPNVRSGTIVHLTPRQAGGVALRIRLLVERNMRAPPGW